MPLTLFTQEKHKNWPLPSPHTPKSTRECDKKQSYLESYYQINSSSRIFPISHRLQLNVSHKSILTSCISVWFNHSVAVKICSRRWRLMKPPYLGHISTPCLSKKVSSISTDTSYTGLFTHYHLGDVTGHYLHSTGCSVYPHCIAVALSLGNLAQWWWCSFSLS